MLVDHKEKGEEIVSHMLEHDDFFKEATANPKDDFWEVFKETEEGDDKTSDKENDRKCYKDVYIKSLLIILDLWVDPEGIEMPVSHYTKITVAEKLLFDKTNDKNDDKDKRDYFRLHSVSTSNDPKEGKTLFRYLFPEENEPQPMEEFGAFVGCFIMDNDSLTQFRLYGKTNEKEGTGVSIALEKDFFNDNVNARIDGVKSKPESNEKKVTTSDPLPLFRCLYIDPHTPDFFSVGQKDEYAFFREKKETEFEGYKQTMAKLSNGIQIKLGKLQKEIKDLDHNVVRKLLLRLRYLVKHAAFKDEQECRIIRICSLENNEVKANEDNRLYVNYLKLNERNVNKICFAPKASNIENFKQHLVRNRYKDIICRQSEMPLV